MIRWLSVFGQLFCWREQQDIMERADRVELLAPAGSPEGFYGALKAGADAVYLGGSRFGARAYAENFTQEELVECLKYGRLFGVKIYLTVNTLLKEWELAELPGYLEPFYRAGLTGVIVQDLGVLRLIREQFPGLKIHASTQMTLCSSYGARLLKEMGACRIVPARELSLKEIAVIKSETDIELETFVHGAMCYCYSGQCLFSSILGGRSGNRGRCAQPCRLPYTVNEEKGGRISSGTIYPLSLKDMCTIDHLPSLIEAGIDSFKIEGRMKRPEYAAGVTAVYRKYIDLYCELREKLGAHEAALAYRVEDSDHQILSGLYIRSETQTGYYFQQNGRQMVTLKNPAYNATEEKLLADIRGEYLAEKLRLPVQVEARFLTGQPALVRIRCGENEGSAEGEPVQKAQNHPITEENLRRQLNRLGDSPFRVEALRIQVAEDAFYPLKQINELRRQAAWELEQTMLAMPENKRPGRSIEPEKYRLNWSTESRNKRLDQSTAESDSCGIWTVSVRTLEQLESLSDVLRTLPGREISLGRLYVEGDLFVKRQEALRICRRLTADKGGKILAALPYIVRQSDEPFLERLRKLAAEGKIDGFLVRSLDGLGFVGERGMAGEVRADAGLYVWNSQAAAELSELTTGFCIPYELRNAEQRVLRGLPAEKIVYSRIPMMVTANCVLKTVDGCRRDSDEEIWLTDRYRKDFPVLRNCLHCTNIIYNSLPFALFPAGELKREWRELRLDFTLETGRETLQVLRAYWQGGKLPEGQYTTGHEKRGVE